MFKRINNWHLSVLVVVVSVLSVALIQQYAIAQWQDPTDLPGETPASNIVVNPLVDDLQMGSYDILGDNITIDGDGVTTIDIRGGSNLCLNGTGPANCISAWSDVSSTGLWTLHTNGNDIFYNDGNVGIGDSNPAHNLDVQQASGVNAEINLSSISGDYWAVYHDRTSLDLRFWYGQGVTGENKVVFTDSGRLGVGTTDPAYPIHGTNGAGPAGIYGEGIQYGVEGYAHTINGNSGSSERVGVYGHSQFSTGVLGINESANSTGVAGQGLYGVYGEVNAVGGAGAGVWGMADVNTHIGVQGTNTAQPNSNANQLSVGVYGEGYYGVTGVGNNSGQPGGLYSRGVSGEGYYGLKGVSTYAGGSAVYGDQGAGTYAATFIGNVKVDHKTGNQSYLQISAISGAPTAANCNSAGRGRMILDYSGQNLYICVGNSVGDWKAISLVAKKL